MIIVCGTRRYFQMARTLILALCAFALVISVQQAAAGMPCLTLEHASRDLIPTVHDGMPA